MKKILLLFLLLIPFAKFNSVKADVIKDFKSAILIEAKTGKVLYSNNEHEKLSPASMTKIMTLTLVMEALEDNRLSLDEELVASKKAKMMEGSKIFLDEGEKMKVVDLIKSVAIASANDAALVLAERISGTEELFVDEMNKYVKDLGLNDTNFMDCTGLTEENHYSSSYDMSMMAKNLINKFPKIIEYTSIYDCYIKKENGDDFWLVNTNKLLKQYPGIDGLKTGYTSFSKYCLTSTISKNGMRLIGVIMGSSTAKSRNEEMINLLNYGFSNYRSKVVLKKDSCLYEINDIKYMDTNYKLIVKNDIYLLDDEKIDDNKIRFDIEYNGINDKNYVNVYYDDELYTKEELVFDKEIKKSSFINILKKILSEMIKI